MKKFLAHLCLIIFLWIIIDKEAYHGTNYILEEENTHERIKVVNPKTDCLMIVGDTVAISATGNLLIPNELKIAKKKLLNT